MELLAKQQLFTRLVSIFIEELGNIGYEVTFGECFRPKEMAEIYKAQGKGISNSLHFIRLAIDLNLFKGGKFLQTKEEYLEAGEIWERYSKGEINCAWGGRFARVDANHFSIEHNGVR